MFGSKIVKIGASLVIFRPFKNCRSDRRDQFGAKIVKIRAILVIFRLFKDFRLFLFFAGGVLEVVSPVLVN